MTTDNLIPKHKVFGIPLFLVLMYVVFYLTFTIGDPFMGWIEEAFGWLGDFVTLWWAPGSESALKSLLVDGIIAGVGGVVVFLPNIIFLFLAIAILEATGYMARVAFIMDRLARQKFYSDAYWFRLFSPCYYGYQNFDLKAR